jgi:hypothetical protein
MKRLIALAVGGLLLVTGACKSSGSTASSSGSSASTAASSGSAPTGTSGTGVTDTAIKLGIVYPDLKAIPGLTIDHGDYEAAYKAIIADVNANGGINGRSIEPVFAPVNPIGTDPATAACVKLTEDDKVFAVVGSFPTEGPGCYVTQHATAAVGGVQSNAGLSAAKAPWFTPLGNSDKLLGGYIDAFAKDGAFKDKKVGVVTLATDQAQMDQLVVPALKKNGVTPIDTAVIDVTNNDQAAAKAQIGTIAERFGSEGVNVVVTVGQASNVFPQDIEDTSFRPRLIATNADAIQGYVSSNSGPNADVIKDAMTAGGAPQSVLWPAPAMQHCADLVQKATGTQIQDPRTDTADTPDTFVSVTAACQLVTLFTDIAKGAGTVLNNDTFKQAGESLGTVDIPNSGTLTFSATSPDGNPATYLLRYDASKKLFVADDKPTS